MCYMPDTIRWLDICELSDVSNSFDAICNEAVKKFDLYEIFARSRTKWVYGLHYRDITPWIRLSA